MADFAELMNTFRTPGEDGLPEDFADQLQAAYDETVDTYTGTGATLTEQLETANAARDAAETAKKTAQAHNARLMKTLPANREKDSGSGGTGEKDGDTFPEPVTIDSLIEYK